MHMDPLLPNLVASAFLVLLAGAVTRRLGQPHVIAYLIVGVVLGPHVLGLYEDQDVVARIGEVGVILLLFFAGLEVDLRRLVTGWKVSVIGTLLQVAGSLAAVGAIGLWLDWPLARIILFGFAISLSSTALLLSMLRQWGELETPAGQDALGILLVQDVIVIGMLIVLGFLGGQSPSWESVALQLAGAAAVLLVVLWIARGRGVRLPFGKSLLRDHELQVFAAFLVCFGLAWASAALHLSSALGAFVAGLIVASSRATDWVHRSLEPYRVILVAVFFASVGMLLDLDFLVEHWGVVLALVFVAFATNTVINAGIMRALGRGWRTSFYIGALLSQIGEFSFVLAAVGKQGGMISEFAYQGVVAVIAGTLVLSPAWISVWRPRRGPSARVEPPAATSTEPAVGH